MNRRALKSPSGQPGININDPTSIGAVDRAFASRIFRARSDDSHRGSVDRGEQPVSMGTPGAVETAVPHRYVPAGAVLVSDWYRSQVDVGGDCDDQRHARNLYRGSPKTRDNISRHECLCLLEA